MLSKIKKNILQLTKNPLCRYLGGIFLFVLLVFSYRNYARQCSSKNYKIFDFNKTISWYETGKGIVRKGSKGKIDNILLSLDKWHEFEISFDLINPNTFTFVFHYLDAENFDYIFFNPKLNIILFGVTTKGETDNLRSGVYRFSTEQKCVFRIKGQEAQVLINDRLLLNQNFSPRNGKFGLILNEAFEPQTIFHDLKVKGTLENGRFIFAQSPSKFNPSPFWYASRLLPIFIFILLINFTIFSFLARSKTRLPLSDGRKSKIDEILTNGFVVGLTHFIFAAFLFWPFFTKGHIFISSYDNFGEIFPLFFFSKHNFINFLQTKTLSLWNPFSHNGIPFYTSHWNMIFYPINWIIFMFSDEKALALLTMKTFLEVFLIGWLAYGFFVQEIKSRPWAFFCSIVYQLCSLLLFSLTIFPTTSLYFCMTLYLYLLWTIHKRRTVVNYVFLTLSIYLLLTSANMAFIFYGLLSLSIVTLYRFSCLPKEERQFWSLSVIVSWITGFLLAAVRILPCVWGIMKSNRLVSGYYTLHDRFFMFLRLWIPDIAGRPGWGGFSVLTSDKLNLIFKGIGLPSNSQNTFFVYFGILSAFLLMVSLLIKTHGRFAFWKVYSLVALAIALLWQPIWGVLSILLFPLNHYSYHTIILPVGLCSLFGYAGLYLEKEDVNYETLGKKFFIFLSLIICYSLVFLTYLFPSMTAFTRIIFIFMLAGYGIFFLLRKKPEVLEGFLLGTALIVNAFIWVLLFVVSTFVLLKPLPRKELLAESILIPFVSVLAIIASGGLLFIYRERFQQKTLLKLMLGLIFLVVFVFTILVVSSSFFTAFLGRDASLCAYVSDVSFAYLKLFLIAFVFVISLILMKKKILSRSFVMLLFIAIVAFDLLIFNFRNDNLAAPSYHKAGSFYAVAFPYRDMQEDIKKKMDLVNYRVSLMHNAGLNANKNLIFSVPSYTGIMGYMPKRFLEFIHAFGYPKDTILIYPEDDIANERFLDLSSVKYVIEENGTLTQRPTALSRLHLFYSYEVIRIDELMLFCLTAESFNHTQKVLLHDDLKGGLRRNTRKSSKPIPIEESSSDGIMANVAAEDFAFVLFNESYDKGWKAYVDGKEVSVIIANYNFMACAVEPGLHKVVFKYEPKEFFIARNISLFGMIVFVLGIFLFLFVRLRRA